MRTRRTAAGLAVALVLGACGGSQATAPPTGAQPIQAPKNTWTWVDFPDSSCGDGSATGIGVNPGDSSNVLVFMEGGGACWTYGNCFVQSTLQFPPRFGSADFALFSAHSFTGVLDRNEAANPFRDWSLVYVPYCTGDVHAGDRVWPYTDPQGGAHPFHHVGHRNVQAFLKRLAATFPDPPKLAVSGSSAGGFGAFANYDTFRSFWPSARLYLIDDSGPPLQGREASTAVDQFDVPWNVYATLDAFCPACRQDLSNAFAALSTKYPNDRVSLLSYERDTIIPLFFSMTTDTFVARLSSTALVIDPLPSAKYFLVGGTAPGSPSGHTLLRNPGSFTVGGAGLWDFLEQQVSDSTSWASHAAL
jgi:hypothetical protein